MNQADYTRITYDFAMAAATVLARLNPEMTFIYVSGEGTDSTQRGRSMWARVKGKTENALFELPFGAAYMFRPALIQPLHGIKSRTTLYRFFYAALRPLMPLLKLLFPGYVTTTEKVAQAMITVAKSGTHKPVLQTRDINALANPP